MEKDYKVRALHCDYRATEEEIYNVKQNDGSPGSILGKAQKKLKKLFLS